MTLRRLQVFLNGLPPESRYQTALRNSLPAGALEDIAADHDPSTDRWSKAETLLAGLDERMQLLLIAVISAVGGKPPDLAPIYRPGNPRPAAETADQRAARRAALRSRVDATNSALP